MTTIDVPETFESLGGRRFTVATHVELQERWVGDPLWNEHREILMEGKRFGTLWKSNNYGPDLLWQVTTRELAWSGGGLPPLGVCFDGGPHATAAEALAEFARIADETLDWRAGKRVKSIYSKTGYYQRDPHER